MTVVLPHRMDHDDPRFLSAIRADAGRLFRKTFGLTGRARVARVIVDDVERWILQCQVEGHPVHDPEFRDRTSAVLAAHYRRGFGSAARVDVEAGLLAGDAQDGAPPDQWIILPSLERPSAAEGVH